MKVWATPLGKELRPVEVLAEVGRNREWVVGLIINISKDPMTSYRRRIIINMNVLLYFLRMCGTDTCFLSSIS